MSQLRNILSQLDMLFAYYLLATEGSMKERVLEAAIAEWQSLLIGVDCGVLNDN